jgi:uncharacterized protein YjlB
MMVEKFQLQDDGTFPNSTLPLLLYRKAVDVEGSDPAAGFERRFDENGWDARWRDGIYPFHHFHSTAHEVLGIARGNARVQFGGDSGVEVDVEAGDVVVIPAGVAHKNLGSSGDLLVVGGYPRGQEWDMNRGQAGERPQVDRNIAAVPLPDSDPVEGAGGTLTEAWRG